MIAVFTKSNETISDGCGYFLDVTDATHLYNGTPVGCPARNLLLDMYVQEGCEEWMTEDDVVGEISY